MAEPKKLVVFYGNCQISALKDMIAKAAPDLYDYHLTMNFTLIHANVEDVPDIFRKADVFVYQPLEKYGRLDTAYVIEHVLPKDCQLISFAKLVSTGLYPDNFHDPANELTKTPELVSGKFFYGHKRLAEAFAARDRSMEEVVEMCKTDAFLDPAFILEQHAYSLGELKRREENTMIKMHDFIMENFKTTRLFYTHTHPTEFLLKEVARRIAVALGLDLSEALAQDTQDYLAKPQTCIIYPCIVKTLGLEFDLEEARYCWCGGPLTTFDEYVREYGCMHAVSIS